MATHIAKGVPKNLLFCKLNFNFEELHYSAGGKVKSHFYLPMYFIKISHFLRGRGGGGGEVGKRKCFKICYLCWITLIIFCGMVSS